MRSSVESVAQHALALAPRREGDLEALAHLALLELPELRRDLVAIGGQRLEALAQREGELPLGGGAFLAAALVEASLREGPLRLCNRLAACLQVALRLPEMTARRPAHSMTT